MEQKIKIVDREKYSVWTTPDFQFVPYTDESKAATLMEIKLRRVFREMDKSRRENSRT